MRRENGIIADPNTEIMMTSGATQAIFVAMNTLLNPGDEVLLPTPLFSAYKYSALSAGGVPVELPTIENQGFVLDHKAIESSCTTKTKILVLNSPCNPTGTVFERKDIEHVCEIADRHGLIVISDEIYEKYLYNGATHFSPASKDEFRERVITINGFSKIFAMTGWRLGYAAAKDKIITAMTRYNMYNAVCASSFVQAAGVAALKHSLSFFKPILIEFSRKRKMIGEYLDQLRFDYQMPGGAFYFFPRIPLSPNSNSVQLLWEQY